MFVCVFVHSFVCFLALRPRPTVNVISGLSVILTLINNLKAFRTRERGKMSVQIHTDGIIQRYNKTFLSVDG